MTKETNKVNANESEIASHWREEELIYPSNEFANQANINDKNIKQNFEHGRFKFVTVWDKLESKLINAIDYLNEKSKLTVYAVTFEYYGAVTSCDVQ